MGRIVGYHAGPLVNRGFFCQLVVTLLLMGGQALSTSRVVQFLIKTVQSSFTFWKSLIFSPFFF